MADDYITLAELKATLGITDATVDAEIGDAITAASRGVDDDTGRRFWLDGAVTVRTYPVRGRVVRDRDGTVRLLVDDIGSTTGLVVETGYGTTWTAVTDYDTLPDNAIADGKAITALSLSCGSWGSGRVRVTALHGWPSVPAQIKQATRLRAARLYRRKGSPQGVAGFGDMGVIRVSRWDPDYDQMIAPFVRPKIG